MTTDAPAAPPAAIHRCGFCGYPVRPDGGALEGIASTEDAVAFLERHNNAEVILANGFCCPGGFEEQPR